MNDEMNFKHETVLLQETVAMLDIKHGAIVVDCTAGGGGHTAALLDAVGDQGRVIAIDQDEVAISHLQKRFSQDLQSTKLQLVHDRFSNLLSILEGLQCFGKIHGICADLGVSSHHLDVAERGFSFMRDGPLDMRMNQSANIPTASDIVNTYEEEHLANIIYRYGEEPKSRYIAKAIVRQRAVAPITTTAQLAELVKEAVFYKKASRKHPATKTFQALRIEVNHELNEVKSLITDAFEALQPLGRLAVISFHSLEDRMVKQTYAELAGKVPTRDREMRHLPFDPLEDAQAVRGRLIKPYPANPSNEEIQRNPRSRSAKLRVIEKTK